MDDNSTRLNKHLALQLGVARREADEIIESGRVEIDGAVATLGARFHPHAVVTINGKPITDSTAYVYLALNKPVGYVCSRRAQDGNPTIYELLPQKYHTLKPVGRLDKDSSGLILLSNDGDFAYQMTHPKFYKVKVYEVKLDHALEPLHHQMIADYGVDLTDGKSKLSVQRIEEKPATYEVTMSEGRNRQIRRTFGALGYTVVAIHRHHFGAYSVGELGSGEYKELTLS